MMCINYCMVQIYLLGTCCKNENLQYEYVIALNVKLIIRLLVLAVSIVEGKANSAQSILRIYIPLRIWTNPTE